MAIFSIVFGYCLIPFGCKKKETGDVAITFYQKYKDHDFEPFKGIAIERVAICRYAVNPVFYVRKRAEPWQKNRFSYKDLQLNIELLKLVHKQ